MPAITPIKTLEGIRRADDIEPEMVNWIWEGRFPEGMLIMIDGDPGLGKSLLTIDFAAHFSTGRPWPDGKPCPVGNTLIVSYEDSQSHTIKPRLLAAGADCARVFSFEYVPDDNGGHPLTLPDDIEWLAKVIDTHGINFVILDPFIASISSKEDSWKSQSIRRATNSLVQLIDEKEVSVICLRHLNKREGLSALYRGEGSVSMIALVRMGYMVVPDRDDSNLILFVPTKHNIAKKPDNLAFRVGENAYGQPVIVWAHDAPQGSVNDLLNNKTTTKRDECEQWLIAFLRSGKASATEVQEAAATAGYKTHTLRRAREALGIKPLREDDKWWWELPDRLDI